MICWSDVCFDVFFIVCLGMHSLVFTCLVALAPDRNDSDLKSGLCLSVVSTPRHGNTFAFKPRPLNPHFFWCPIVPVHVSMYVLMWVFKCVLPNALMYVLINVPMYVLINALMYVLIKVLMTLRPCTLFSVMEIKQYTRDWLRRHVTKHNDTQQNDTQPKNK